MEGCRIVKTVFGLAKTVGETDRGVGPAETDKPLEAGSERGPRCKFERCRNAVPDSGDGTFYSFGSEARHRTRRVPVCRPSPSRPRLSPWLVRVRVPDTTVLGALLSWSRHLGARHPLRNLPYTHVTTGKVDLVFIKSTFQLYRVKTFKKLLMCSFCTTLGPGGRNRSHCLWFR